MVRLPEADGGEMYVALPSSPGPGVVVLHAWWGLVPDIKAVCDRLAAEGFVAVAPDLHGGQTASTPDAAERLVQATPWEARAKMAEAAARWLRGQAGVAPDRVALLGFSMGGFTAFRAAAAGVGDAVVAFYSSGYLGPDERITVPVLGLFAEDDPFEPADDTAAFVALLKERGTPVTAITYPGTGHWFFEPSQAAYHPAAAQAAWEETLRFLRTHLNG